MLTAADDLLTRAPERVALIEADAECRYQDLCAEVLAATSRLRAAGVATNDHVLVIDAPSRLVLVAVFAAMRLGATPTLINPRLTAAEVSTLAGLVSPAVPATASGKRKLAVVPLPGAEVMMNSPP